jgi:RHH-type proline utilization regulon transcriptional repressor/proline dehydrogenase/delta 1-pyrroline-5-carboxylate dehydrogenase
MVAQLGAQLAGPPLFRPVVSRVVRESVFAMAHRFIAGETPELAVPRLRELAREGVGYTVDLLGEATLSEPEADSYAQRYAGLIDTLAAAAPGLSGGRWQGLAPVNVSIKLSSLYSQFEAAAPNEVGKAVRKRLDPILRLALARGAFVNVDMEQFRYKDLVQRIFADVALDREFAVNENLGLVVQAYLESAEDDIDFLHDLARERGASITVRLVKGAYWEEERITASQNSWDVPVFEQKAATDASFERCTDRLLAAWPHLRAAFGSHNPRSIAQAIVKSRERGVADGVEFQMLFGMAETLRRAVAAEGFRTRVYVPVGAVIPGMAYLVRRLLENTSNQSWFVRESLPGSADAVLAVPQVRPPRVAPGPAPLLNAPPAQFHRPGVRLQMRAALDSIRRRFGATEPLLIGEHEVRDRPLQDICYPAEPGLLLGRVAQATREDVAEAVVAARTAFPDWRDRPVSVRAAILRNAADMMLAHRYELAALMVYESAKPWHEADGDVVEACDYLRYYALQAERIQQPRPLLQPLGEENTYLREPRGVTAVIAPWNFPLAIICGMASAALASGNCAIFKPAAQSPLVAARLVRLLRDAGVPPGVVQFLPGPGSEAGQALVEHPGVDTIAFTGSKEVGLGILRSAAPVRPGQRNVKRVIAEMGGKNAVIIDEDADLDQALAGVLVSAFGYAGQKCSACSRVIVVGNAYEEALERMAAATRSLIVGPPHDPSTFVPPVISEQARSKILSYIDNGRRSARLVAQAAVPDVPGWYVPPTVFAGVGADDSLAREEIFGPVLCVFHAADIDEALALANDSEFALTGGLFSRNPRNIERVRRELEVGNLYINRKITGAVVGRQPFGGLRMSGFGEKAGGQEYLLQFTEPRTITENTTRRGFAPEGVVFDGTRAQ